MVGGDGDARDALTDAGSSDGGFALADISRPVVFVFDGLMVCLLVSIET